MDWTVGVFLAAVGVAAVVAVNMWRKDRAQRSMGRRAAASDQDLGNSPGANVWDSRSDKGGHDVGSDGGGGGEGGGSE